MLPKPSSRNDGYRRDGGDDGGSGRNSARWRLGPARTGTRLQGGVSSLPMPRNGEPRPRACVPQRNAPQTSRKGAARERCPVNLKVLLRQRRRVERCLYTQRERADEADRQRPCSAGDLRPRPRPAPERKKVRWRSATQQKRKRQRGRPIKIGIDRDHIGIWTPQDCGKAATPPLLLCYEYEPTRAQGSSC